MKLFKTVAFCPEETTIFVFSPCDKNRSFKHLKLFLSLNPFYDHSDHIPFIKTTLNYNFHKSKINLLIKIFFGNTNLETFMLFVFKNLIGVKDNLDLFLFLFCQQKGMIKPWRWHQFKRDKWMVHSQYYFALLHTQSL